LLRSTSLLSSSVWIPNITDAPTGGPFGGRVPS
jgi:hypothetical protein